jgi:NAD(P)-dependent dehydrogenase (short-subunit alcohol dehydrogenase family)
MSSRNVLVTGGSGGIGRAIVKRFAHGGDSVWFTYRFGRERASTLVDELRRDGMPSVDGFEFDQGDRQSHQQLLNHLPGTVDILINNAAVGSETVRRYVPGDDGYRQDEAFFQINCVGPLWLVRGLAPGMVDRGYGKIFNIASVGGGVAQFPGFDIADGMSKAALAYLTRHVAAELAHTGVDVLALCPGAVETTMFEASTLAHLTPDQRRALEARLPKGRLLQPEEIADLVWLLCGDDVHALHGAVIDASMGLGVHPGLLTGDQPENATGSL